MEAIFEQNRQLAVKTGVDPELIRVYTEQKGYGRQGVNVSFYDFHFGEIDDLYLGDVYPNIDEHWDNFDEFNERKLSHEELIAERYSTEIAEYLRSIDFD